MPERLAEVGLIVAESDVPKLVASLAELGTFHPARPKLEGEEDAYSRRVLGELSSKLDKVDRYLREAGLELSDATGELVVGEGGWRESAERALRAFAQIEEPLDRVIEEIERSRETLAQLTSRREELEHFKDFDVDLDELSRLERVKVAVGSMTLQKLEEVFRSLEERRIPHVALMVREDDSASVVLICRSEDFPSLSKMLERGGFKPLQIPENYPRTPSLAYRAIVEDIERFEDRLRSMRREIASRADELRLFHATFYTLREVYRVLSSLLRVGRMAFLAGYVPERKEKEFVEAIDKATGGRYLLLIGSTVRGSEERGAQPTLVRVPKPLKPFHWLVTQYGTPASHELVPTIFVAVTFPLLYALMFPDAGHALAIMAFGALVLKTARGRETREILGMLALYLGAASFVSGVLAGEFFGPVTGLSELLWHGHPPLASPIEAGAEGGAFELLMLAAFRLAAVMLISGTLFGVVNSILAGNVEDALTVRLPKFLLFLFATYPFLFFDLKTAGLVIYDATFGGAATFEGALTRYGCLASLFGLLMLEPIIEGVKHGLSHARASLGAAFLELFESVLLVIGNTASFLRIMGLAVAHSGMVVGFMLLAELVNGGVLGSAAALLIYAIGNLMAIALEGIIVFAHTLRLHFYEWFTKFYLGTGFPFRPVVALAKIRVT
ncbi:MAG: V-type ATPase 116kDa subunit family protein [Fervidicoccaceae archaeon]